MSKPTREEVNKALSNFGYQPLEDDISKIFKQESEIMTTHTQGKKTAEEILMNHTLAFPFVITDRSKHHIIHAMEEYRLLDQREGGVGEAKILEMAEESAGGLTNAGTKWERTEHIAGFQSGFKKALSILPSSDGDRWVSVDDKLPPLGENVLCVRNYSKYNNDLIDVLIGKLHHAESPQAYGGPNSVQGSGYLTGHYWSFPSICKFDIVTHWQPKPNLPRRNETIRIPI